MKRSLAVVYRVAFEVITFLIVGGFLFSSLIHLQPRVSIRYQYEKQSERQGFLPLEVKTEAKKLSVKGTMTLSPIHGILFVLRPDDCVESMKVNSRALPSDLVKFCHARPGKRINLSPYLVTGENTIEWTIRDTGGTGGMAMPLSWLDPVFLALVGSLVALVISLGMHLLSLFCRGQKQAQILFLICLAALLLRLGLSWHPGYGYDIKLNKQWAANVASKGIGHAYQIDPSKGSRPNYPPLNLIVLAAAHSVYTTLAPLPPSENWSVWYHAIMKTPAIIADVVICLLLFFLCSSFTSKRNGLIAAGLYALHPDAIYVSALWGQTDSVYVMAMLASLLVAIRKQWILFGLFLGASFLLKVQSVIVLPLAIFFLFEKGAWWRVMVGLLVSFFLVLLPFLLNHTVSDVIQAYFSSIGFYHSLTMGADNIWVILFGPLVKKSSLDTILGVPFRTIGVVVFSLITVGLLALAYKVLECGSRRKEYGIVLLLLLSLITFSFFFFNAEMHERYFFPFIVFGLPFIFIGRREKWLYGASSLLFFGNLSHIMQVGSGDRIFWKTFTGLRSFIAVGLLFVFFWLLLSYASLLRTVKARLKKTA